MEKAGRFEDGSSPDPGTHLAELLNFPMRQGPTTIAREHENAWPTYSRHAIVLTVEAFANSTPDTLRQICSPRTAGALKDAVADDALAADLGDGELVRENFPAGGVAGSEKVCQASF